MRLGDGGKFVVVGVEATRVDAEMKMEIVNQAEDTATSEVILDAPFGSSVSSSGR